MYHERVFSREITGAQNGRARCKVCTGNWQASIKRVSSRSMNIGKYAKTRKLIVLFLVMQLLLVACGKPFPQDSDPIPATNAIGCNTNNIGASSGISAYPRSDPQWVRISNYFQDTTILEGTVPGPTLPEPSNAQAPSEVSEEEVPWNHYTHDMTFKVLPDPGYKHLLSSYMAMDSQGNLTGGVHSTIETEWETGAFFDENFWPAVGDRIWVEGRWVFDCGHNGLSNDNPTEVNKCGEKCVRYETEMHPPRALAVFRQHRGGLLSLNGHMTWVPVTQADIFVSGNGGGANDACSLVIRHINVVTGQSDDCQHTGPIIPINDRNYVFDIYPPGTDYRTYEDNLTFRVHPPSSNASVVAIPTFTLVGSPIQPLLCPIDATTPPPTQTETACPQLPAHPTRIRVILPFKGSQYTQAFRESIQVGWNVPPTTSIRTFRISLHEFKIIHNGESTVDGDWRVYVNVGGQWRYLNDDLSPDTNNPNCQPGDGLNENGDGDCFQYDGPGSGWGVVIQDGTIIHVAVGGYESDAVDSHYCSDPAGCDFSTAAGDSLGQNDDRIGTTEFDLFPPYYNFTQTCDPSKTICQLGPVTTQDVAGDQYQVTFTVQEVPTPPPTFAEFSPLSAQINCDAKPSQTQFLETITNTGTQQLDWTASSNDSGIHVSPNSGSIPPGMSQTVKVRGIPKFNSPTGDIEVIFDSNGGGQAIILTCI
jgi:hypothetical protein